LASLSPKFSNSTPKTGSIEAAWIERHDERRLDAGVISEWIKAYPSHQIKAVVASEQDANEAMVFFRFSVPDVASDRIFLMPEGTDAQILADRGAWLVDFCKRSGYRYCNRLQIELFGNTRGT
jgi:7-carboxy-7-deazaguanine synthase